MLTDRAAVLRKIMDLRNLLDQLHKRGFRLKSRREGMALSRVIHILRESEAFRGGCVQPRAIVKGWDPNRDDWVPLNEVDQVIRYLRNFENLNRKVLGKADRLAFDEVRYMLEMDGGWKSVDEFYTLVHCW